MISFGQVCPHVRAGEIALAIAGLIGGVTVSRSNEQRDSSAPILAAQTLLTEYEYVFLRTIPAAEVRYSIFQLVGDQIIRVSLNAALEPLLHLFRSKCFLKQNNLQFHHEPWRAAVAWVALICLLRQSAGIVDLLVEFGLAVAEKSTLLRK